MLGQSSVNTIKSTWRNADFEKTYSIEGSLNGDALVELIDSGFCLLCPGTQLEPPVEPLQLDREYGKSKVFAVLFFASLHMHLHLYISFSIDKYHINDRVYAE
jgi:hypothetical protein